MIEIKDHSSYFYGTGIRIGSVVVLAAIAVAGLWPFGAPRNDVAWLHDRDGLRFGQHGLVVSSGSLPTNLAAGSSCSLEIRLQSDQLQTVGSILSFDSSPDPRLPFLLQQRDSSLTIQRYAAGANGKVRYPWAKVDGVFTNSNPALLTITSTRQNLDVYLNAVLLAQFAGDNMRCSDLKGRFILANSTSGGGWVGEISELAVYDRELTRDEIGREFASSRSTLGIETQPIALYLFRERSGQVTRSQTRGPDLVIPRDYLLLHPALLTPILEQYSYQGSFWRRWSFWQDIGLNIAGFVPLGIILMAYWSLVKRNLHSEMRVILSGFLVSLTIEVGQRFLPTRDSGMMDLVTNTTGTVFGVLIYRLSGVQVLLARVAISLGRSWNTWRDSLVETFQSQKFKHCRSQEIGRE